jgi:hypothetical protein
MNKYLQNDSFLVANFDASKPFQRRSQGMARWHNQLMKTMVVFVFMMLYMVQASYSQCYTSPNYCTTITAANNANFGMGIQRVNLGTSASPNQINNITTAGFEFRYVKLILSFFLSWYNMNSSYI